MATSSSRLTSIGYDGAPVDAPGGIPPGARSISDDGCDALSASRTGDPVPPIPGQTPDGQA